MLSQDVRLSVSLSVTRLYCAETAKHIFKLLSPPSSHNTLVLHQTLCQYSDGMGPSNGGVKCREI